MSDFDNAIPLSLVPGSKALDRQAVLPPDDTTITFGMHGALCDHYNYTPDVQMPGTLDFLVASVGGCLIGTFAGSLRRARVRIEPEDLTATAHGSIAPDEEGILVLSKITMAYRLRLDEAQREAAEEVHAVHVGRCPNARSVMPAIEIDSGLEIVSPVTA